MSWPRFGRGLASAGLLVVAVSLPRLAAADPLGGVEARAWGFPARLGLQLQAMTEELREYFGAPPDAGVLVTRVLPGKPAEEAGVRVGDVIVAVDGDPVASPHEVILAVGSAPAGDPLRLEIVRGGKRRTLEVVPEGEPVPWLDPEPWIDLRDRVGRGLERGRRELERRLRDLERRMDELERRLQEGAPPGPERT